MRLSLPIAVCFLMFVYASPLRGQVRVDGFMRGQHKASLAVTHTREAYDTYYVGKQPVQDPNLDTVSTQAWNIYATYGLGYDLDLIVNASYVSTEASAGYWPKQTGWQDVSAMLRWEAYDYKIGKGRLSWLFTVGYSQPIQKYVSDTFLAIGRGSRNLEGRTMLHFKTGAFFLTGQFGYIRRGPVVLDRVANYYDPNQVHPTGGSKVNVPDATELVFRSGISTKYVYLDGWFQQQTPFTKGTDIAPGIPFPTNAIGFTRAGATLYVPIIKKFGLTAAYSKTLTGQNTGKPTSLTGGVVIGI